jgi:hypothetical protein
MTTSAVSPLRQRRSGPRLRCSKNHLYSSTSSVRKRIDCGTTRPSALAVLRFRTLSNFVGS